MLEQGVEGSVASGGISLVDVELDLDRMLVVDVRKAAERLFGLARIAVPQVIRPPPGIFSGRTVLRSTTASGTVSISAGTCADRCSAARATSSRFDSFTCGTSRNITTVVRPCPLRRARSVPRRAVRARRRPIRRVRTGRSPRATPAGLARRSSSRAARICARTTSAPATSPPRASPGARPRRQPSRIPNGSQRAARRVRPMTGSGLRSPPQFFSRTGQPGPRAVSTATTGGRLATQPLDPARSQVGDAGTDLCRLRSKNPRPAWICRGARRSSCSPKDRSRVRKDLCWARLSAMGRP
jgi:hypothetical protein